MIAALPDSVVARPLGLVEEREPRGAPARASRRDGARGRRADLGGGGARAAAGQARAAARDTRRPPPAGDWIVETKFDGYRLMARIDKGRAKLITRGGHDWTDKMKPLAAAIEALGIDSAWLDGEIVVMNEDGLPDFNALQNAIDNAASEAIEYFVFDLPFHDGRDLRKVPLRARRALLGALLDEARRATGSASARRFRRRRRRCSRRRADAARRHHHQAPRRALRVAAQRDLAQAQVRAAPGVRVCGFTDRSGARGEVGSLFLGTYEKGVLTYAGNVGTGWNARTARDLHARLVALETTTPTLAIEAITPGRWSRRSAGAERWVGPELVAEVSFREWTPEGHVRHAVFVALRLDKPAREVTREVARRRRRAPRPRRRRRRASRSRNPDRVIDPSTGITKVDAGALLREHRRAHPAAPARPAGVARPRARRHHRRAVLPEASGDAHAGPARARPEALAGPRGAARRRHARRPGLGGADEHDRVPHLELDREARSTSPIASSSTSTRAKACVGAGPGGGAPDAGHADRARPGELAEDERRQGPARRRAARPELDYDVVKGFSQAVVTHLAKTIPQRFVAKSGGSNRVGRIFVDYLRNGHGQTTAAAFSARSRPGLGVSMPVAWEQLMA